MGLEGFTMKKMSVSSLLMLALASAIARTGSAVDLAFEPITPVSNEAGSETRPFLDVLSATDEEASLDPAVVDQGIASGTDGHSFASADGGSYPVSADEDSGNFLTDYWADWNPRGSFRNFLDETTEGFWIAGTEVSFLHIRARTGGTITASFSDTTAPGVATERFNTGYGLIDNGYAPRVWVGRQITPKWAIVGRFWSISDSTNGPPRSIESTGSNFATFEEMNQFNAYAIDIEAVRSIQLGKWKLDGSVGSRTLNFDVKSSFLAFGVFTTGNFVNLTLQNACQFNGTGVTFGLAARRQIGELPLYVYASGRGSHINGETFSLGRSDGTVASSPSAPLVGAATVTRRDQQASAIVGELQTGFQLDYELANADAGVFVRMGLEYQHWTIEAAPTGGAGFGGTIGELTTNSFASAGIGDLQLLGISVATGINW